MEQFKVERKACKINGVVVCVYVCVCVCANLQCTGPHPAAALWAHLLSQEWLRPVLTSPGNNVREYSIKLFLTLLTRT